MPLFYESLKPTQLECTIEKWREHATKMRKFLEERNKECRDLRNESRKMRLETGVKKAWDFYLNNAKLHERVHEIEVLILYAENMLPKIVNEKKMVEEEKFQTEIVIQKCDGWIGVCMEGLNSLDRKMEKEMTRNDEGIQETHKEIKLLEEAKDNLKNECELAWEISCRLMDAEAKLELNLEFKNEVLRMDIRNQAIDRLDTGVSFKVEPTKGPSKMTTIEEWSKTVYGLVERGQKDIQDSMKLRERMSATRGVILNEYAIQFDKTDYAMRKRIYEINREKNERQYQLLKVQDLMAATRAEWKRLELFLDEVKTNLKCAETRCSERYFRPSVDATIDPPFTGMNKEVNDLQGKVKELEEQLNALKTFYNKLDADSYKLSLECEAKNKALQIQIKALDIRISGRYDPKKIYAYNPHVLMSKMVTEMPPPCSLYSNKI